MSGKSRFTEEDEKEVWDLLNKGFSTKQISIKKNIAQPTVYWLLKKASEKLGNPINTQNNTKVIHISATIQFYINNNLIFTKKYYSKKERQSIIDTFRMMYPINPNQTRYFIIKPNWEEWRCNDNI